MRGPEGGKPCLSLSKIHHNWKWWKFILIQLSPLVLKSYKINGVILEDKKIIFQMALFMLEPLNKFINQVETFLQTRNSGNKDTNYMLAILDSRFANTTSSVIFVSMVKSDNRNQQDILTILNDEADSELTFALGKVRNFQPSFFYRIASTASKTTTTKVHKSFFKDIHLQHNRCHYLPRKIQQQTNHTSLM